ncbi:unnamed protein product [Boreogadus saida]
MCAELHVGGASCVRGVMCAGLHVCGASCGRGFMWAGLQGSTDRPQQVFNRDIGPTRARFTLVHFRRSSTVLGGWIHYRLHPSRGAGGSLTSLLVQPISASLAKRLLSSPTSPEGGGACIPLATPPHSERKKVRLTIGNQWTHSKIYNLVGHLRGRRNSELIPRE